MFFTSAIVAQSHYQGKTHAKRVRLVLGEPTKLSSAMTSPTNTGTGCQCCCLKVFIEGQQGVRVGVRVRVRVRMEPGLFLRL